MPLYEYQCDACGSRFEVIQKFSDPLVESCRHCGKGPVHKLFSSPAIQFKGTGFYITDYAQKDRTDASSSSAAAKTTDSATPAASAATSDTGGAAKSDTTAPAAPAATPSPGGATKDSKP